VNLGDANTELNPAVPTMFAAVTFIFVVFVVVARLTVRGSPVLPVLLRAAGAAVTCGATAAAVVAAAAGSV
jgi:hypothetical protein